MEARFGVNSSRLTSEDRSRVAAFAATWFADPKRQPLQVHGYASVDGPVDVNWRLSCDRALAIKQALVENGVPVDQVQAVAHGPTQEFQGDSNEPNRRAGIASSKVVAPDSPCPDSKGLSQERDTLPARPRFATLSVTGSQMLTLVNGMIDIMRRIEPNRRHLDKSPLGFTVPILPMFFPLRKPHVVVSMVDDSRGSPCKKCVAAWEMFRFPILVAVVNTFVVSALRRWVNQGDRFQCSSMGPIGDLKEVRNIVSPDALKKVIEAEHEHWEDAQKSIDLTGSRLLANVRRFTAERTPLRGETQAECSRKIAEALESMGGIPGTVAQLGVEGFLEEGYEALYEVDFLQVFQASAAKRDVPGQHGGAITHPPEDRDPIRPDFDLDRNPFGCDAFARRYLGDCCPGTPGLSTDDVIQDRSLSDGIGPVKMPWHIL